MSAFTPVDVRAPNARRKQLVARLMQQQAAQAPAANRLASVSGRALGAVGGQIGGHAQGIQHNNVLAAVLSKLGVGARGEVDPGFGPHISGADPYSSGHYVAPNEAVGGGSPIAAAGGGAAPAAPAPTFPEGGSAPSLGGDVVGAPDVAYGPSANDPTIWGAAGSDASVGVGGPQNGLVPLGGGMFYDPVNDVVRGGGGFTGAAGIAFHGAR